jgi:iron-sulfur cluster repair protein YtfE (RIC family)
VRGDRRSWFVQLVRRIVDQTQRLREPPGEPGTEVGPRIAKTWDMNAAEARTMLMEQHDRIRYLLEVCTRLARLERAGDAVTTDLDVALARLRDEVAAHNQAETAIVADLLHGPAAWGSLLVDRMLEEHVAEHAAFWELLCGAGSEVAERIEQLSEELDAHMLAEERTFLSPMTLRDDVIRTRTRELTNE